MDIKELTYADGKTVVLKDGTKLINSFQLADKESCRLGFEDSRSDNPVPIRVLLHVEESGDTEKIMMYTRNMKGDYIFIDAVHSDFDFGGWKDQSIAMKRCFEELKKYMTADSVTITDRIKFLNMRFPDS